MSHLSKVKTSMTDISYLKRSLEKLELDFMLVPDKNFNNLVDKIVIPQKKTNIEFVWNGSNYGMETDLSFWEQSLPSNEFLDLVNQNYIYSSLLENSNDLGFTHLKTQGNTLVVERWV